MTHTSKKARKTGFFTSWKIVGLVFVVSFVLLAGEYYAYRGTPPVVAISAAQHQDYQSAARRSLEKLCAEYGCSPGYVDEAGSRFKFLQTTDFGVEAKKDGNPGTDTQNVIAFTSKKEPRWVFVNLDQINKVPSDKLEFLERVLDHEVIHQAAVEQKLAEPLTIKFSNNNVFVGVRSYGLLLLDKKGVYNLYYVNEAITQWLAEPQIRKDFPGFAEIYTEGPRVVERLNYKIGLDRNVAFDLYTNKGVEGFMPYYELLVTPALTAQNQSRRTAALYILQFEEQTLNELNNGNYNLAEAQKRIDDYISTGLAPHR